MEELDFSPAKSKREFRLNYKLHDHAEKIGKNLLTLWGFNFSDFGEDKRFEPLWEKGKDKPDLILHYMDISALLDWKGKRKNIYLLNERAIKAYERWQKEYNVPVIIAFFHFSSEDRLLDKHFALVPFHTYSRSESRQWDKNITVEFNCELPIFNKENLITYLEKRSEKIS